MPSTRKRAQRVKTKDITFHRSYLTKRILIRAARAGVTKAARETLQIMGYTVIARGGWIVKRFRDGRIENIARIEQQPSSNGKIVVD